MTKFIVVTGRAREYHTYDGDRARRRRHYRKRCSTGPTETALFRANNPHASEGEARFLARVPMQRLAQPSEVAAAIAFLAGETAAFITGQTLFVDGSASLGSL